MRATVGGIRQVDLPTVEVEVPEWDGTILLRALTRAQVRACREAAQIGEDRRLDLDTYDLAVLAFALADPDLVVEVGLEEALRLLRAQPVALVQQLVREAVSASGLGPGAPFRRGTADDARRRGISGASDSAGSGRDDPVRDEAEDESV